MLLLVAVVVVVRRRWLLCLVSSRPLALFGGQVHRSEEVASGHCRRILEAKFNGNLCILALFPPTPAGGAYFGRFRVYAVCVYSLHMGECVARCDSHHMLTALSLKPTNQ